MNHKLSQPLKLNLQQLHSPILKSELTINQKGWLYLTMDGYKRRLQDIPYTLRPISELKQLKNLVYQEYQLFINDQFISQAYGESTDNKEDSSKEREYTALVRCCKDLLVASELWDPQESQKLRNLYFERVGFKWLKRPD